MGRERDPFHKRGHSQDGRRREDYENEYDLYEDDLEYEEDDEFEVEDDFDEMGPKAPKRPPAPPLPPFPSRNRRINPRRVRVRYVPEETSPRPPARPTPTTYSKREAYLPDEPQPRERRRPTESYQRPPQQRTRARAELPPPPSSSARRVPAKPPKRSVWPIFLGGCAAGAVSLVLFLAVLVWLGVYSASKDLTGHLGGASGQVIRDQPNAQSVSLSALSQLIVCDTAGNISLSVDPNPNATNATVTTTKIAQTGDQNAAKQTFSQISVLVVPQPSQSSGQSLACQQLQTNPQSTSGTNPTTTSAATNNSVLSVNVTFPPQTMATVDVVITLPQSVVQSQDPSHTLISMQDGQGTVNIDGVSGIMDVQNASGDLNVKNNILVDGSKLQAQEGKLTFNGLVWSTPLSADQRANPFFFNGSIWLKSLSADRKPHLFFSGADLIDLTLPETSSVVIDATANSPRAKITSDLPIKVVTDNNGTSSYQGPFNPAITLNENTAPWLTLQASSGDISMHKAQTAQ